MNYQDFEHVFTQDLDFKRDVGKKIPCFRVIDTEGKVVNRKYEGAVDNKDLVKIFEHMVSINEADKTFN